MRHRLGQRTPAGTMAAPTQPRTAEVKVCEAGILEERIEEGRHLRLAERVRTRPLDDGAFLESVERKSRPDLPQLHRLLAHSEASLACRVHKFDPRLEDLSKGGSEGRDENGLSRILVCIYEASPSHP